MTDAFSNLVQALRIRFSAGEALDMARLLLCSYGKDSITYDELDLDEEVKDDIILLAYEERILLPMKSRRGSAWEDRLLAFSEDERYHSPRIVHYLVEKAKKSGEWHIEEPIGMALEEAGVKNISVMIDYIRRILEVAPKCEMEVGGMQAIGNALELTIDMHDTLDRFVRCGIMSPLTRRTIHTGISWYEINPSLNWK